MGRSKQSKRKHIGDRVLPTREPASEQGLEAAAVMQSRPIETGDVAEDVSIGRNSDSPPVAYLDPGQHTGSGEEYTNSECQIPSDAIGTDSSPGWDSDDDDVYYGLHNEPMLIKSINFVSHCYLVTRSIRYGTETPVPEVLVVFDTLKEANDAAPHFIDDEEDDDFRYPIKVVDELGCIELRVEVGNYMYKVNVTRVPRFAAKARGKSKRQNDMEVGDGRSV